MVTYPIADDAILLTVVNSMLIGLASVVNSLFLKDKI